MLTDKPDESRAYVRDFRRSLGLTEPKDATIIALRQQLKRAYGGYVHPHVKRLAARNSRSEPALQVADMVAGDLSARG